MHYRCPRCGRSLAKKIGPAGFFWGCSYYPHCRNTISDWKGKPFFRHQFNNRCPRCEQGYLIRHKINKKYRWICDESASCGFSLAGLKRITNKRKQLADKEETVKS